MTVGAVDVLAVALPFPEKLHALSKKRHKIKRLITALLMRCEWCFCVCFGSLVIGCIFIRVVVVLSSRDRCITSSWHLDCPEGRDTSVPTTNVSAVFHQTALSRLRRNSLREMYSIYFFCVAIIGDTSGPYEVCHVKNSSRSISIYMTHYTLRWNSIK